MEKINLKGQKTYLTSSGLAVMAWPGSLFFQPFFCSTDGTFRRFMSNSEAQYITQQCSPIRIEEDLYCSPVKWKYLWETLTQDFSDYEPYLCSNGGRYSFATRDIFFGRKVGNNLEIRNFPVYSTGAGFDYDELTGSFQTGLNSVQIIGSDQEIFVNTQSQSEEEVIDHLFDKIWSMEGAINAPDTTVPHKYPMQFQALLCPSIPEKMEEFWWNLKDAEDQEVVVTVPSEEEVQRRKKIFEDAFGAETIRRISFKRRK